MSARFVIRDGSICTLLQQSAILNCFKQKSEKMKYFTYSHQIFLKMSKLLSHFGHAIFSVLIKRRHPAIGPQIPIIGILSHPLPEPWCTRAPISISLKNSSRRKVIVEHVRSSDAINTLLALLKSQCGVEVLGKYKNFI